MIGVLKKGDAYYLLTQGNESEGIVDYAKLLTGLYQQDIDMVDSNSELIELGKQFLPLKKHSLIQRFFSFQFLAAC